MFYKNNQKAYIKFKKVTKFMYSSIDVARKATLFQFLPTTFMAEKLFRNDIERVVKNLNFRIEEGQNTLIFCTCPIESKIMLKLLGKIIIPNEGKIIFKNAKVYPIQKMNIQKPLMTFKTFIKNTLSFSRVLNLNENLKSLVEKYDLEEFLSYKMKDIPHSFTKVILEECINLTSTNFITCDYSSFKYLNLKSNFIHDKRTFVVFQHDPQLTTHRIEIKKALVIHNGELVDNGNVSDMFKSFLNYRTIYLQNKVSTTPQVRPDKVTELSERPDPEPLSIMRKGNRSISIKKLLFYNKDNVEIESLVNGDPCWIKVFYETKIPHALNKEVEISFKFEDQNGPIIGLPSYCQDIVLKTEKTKGVFACYVPKFPLIPGHYYPVVCISYDNKLADKIKGEILTEVTGNNFYKNKVLPEDFLGKTCIEYTWQYQDIPHLKDSPSLPPLSGVKKISRPI